MDADNINTEYTEKLHPSSVLFRVTSFSKYLALILFIALPFVGGWIGYMYGSEWAIKVPVAQEMNTEEVSHESGRADEAPAIEMVDIGEKSDTEPSQEKKSSGAITTGVAVQQGIAMKIEPFSDRILRFEITAHSLRNDHRPYVDYLKFNAATGEVILDGYFREGFESSLLKLYALTSDENLERKLQDMVLAETNEDSYTQRLRDAAREQLSDDLVSEIDFRSFCKLQLLEAEAHSQQNDLAYLKYDTGTYGELDFLSFPYGDPCRIGWSGVVVLDGLLVVNLIPPVDAAEPKVRGYIYLDENTSYVHSRTGELIYKYDFGDGSGDY
jgi:hypothetical protein